MQGSNYDDEAVAILVEIEELIRCTPSTPYEPARRCQMIRGVIEGHVERLDPPPAQQVLAHLTDALVAQAALIGADTVKLKAMLERLGRHLESRGRIRKPLR
jgi:hypothetical protein